jgi:DNA excision repair protein ERCC-5
VTPSLHCRDRFGWPSDKVDELLVPVLQAYDRKQTQLRIDQFLSFSQRFAKIKSKRMQVSGVTWVMVKQGSVHGCNFLQVNKEWR